MLKEKELEYLDISSLAVANYFLSKENHNISNLKLNKLIYISFGWVAGYYEYYLFEERIEAWRFGPVVPSIYHQFKVHGKDVIKDKAIKVTYDDSGEGYVDLKEPEIEDSNLSEDSKRNLKSFLDDVYKDYQKLKPFELVKLTHGNLTPWSRTYKIDYSKREIPKYMIYEYYKIVKDEIS